jgi:UPF0755 protein
MQKTLLSEGVEALATAEKLTQSDNSLWNKHTNRRTILLLLTIAAFVSAFYAYINMAPTNFPAGKLITIPEGSNVRVASEILEREQVISSSWWLYRIIQIQGKAEKVYAGDYVFKEPLTLLQVAKRITSGAFGLEPVKIVIPEGSTAKEIGRLLEKKLMHFDHAAFLAEAEKYEGYLFPDTYFVLPNIKEADIIRVFKDTQTKRLEPLKNKIEASEYNLHEILTIASIIEKEESDKGDRHMIAGVIKNRLKIDMPLQVDATFLYILGKGTFGLSREDLKNQSPYNTYVHKGIPPGPINNPGIATIKAVLEPKAHPYLFYLADSEGTTYYSVTYEEHLAKKRIYIDNVR